LSSPAASPGAAAAGAIIGIVTAGRGVLRLQKVQGVVAVRLVELPLAAEIDARGRIDAESIAGAGT
jgi:hypothetical protein